jgi:hypothetical protein
MRKGLLLAGGVGLGAGLMYVFDPVYGKRRRALIRDKAVHAAGASRVVLDKKARRLGNRARGLLAEAGAHFRCEEASDETLTARVRSKLGRAVSKPEDVEVTTSEGRVTLRGIVRAQEYDGLFRCVSKVRGVLGVENQLKLHGHHGPTPTAARANGNGAHLAESRRAPSRLLVTVVGSGLALYGAKRRGAFGSVVSVVGVRMLRRGLLNVGAHLREGMGGDGHAAS